MKKVKYFYNNQTLRYERLESGFTQKAWRILGFLCATIIFSIVIVTIAYSYLDSPKEKLLKREISKMKLQYELMAQKLDQVQHIITDLEDKDDNIYRVIFEAEPIPKSVRQAGYGGASRYNGLETYKNSELMIETAEKLDKIKRQVYIQSKSYDELYKMIQNKENMLASIPAIQPVANKDLKRMASGYGYRIDPIYKTPRMHWGMDFTAPRGTEIYATGDGKVEMVKHSNRGYGRHLVINHGYGYKTLYAHMSRIKVRKGQTVKRGQIIGYVGNSGKSVGPHLHYEVLKDGNKVNPVNYYYNDLTPEEYEKMLEISARHSQSFD